MFPVQVSKRNYIRPVTLYKQLSMKTMEENQPTILVIFSRKFIWQNGNNQIEKTSWQPRL